MSEPMAPLERIPFCTVRDRPRLTLPDGDRLAVLVVPNIEFYEYVAPPNPVRTAWARMPQPDVLGYGARDYGNRVGLGRLFRVMDELDVRATMSLNIAILERFPDLLEEFESRRWDAACHGLYNTRYLWGMSREEELEHILTCRELFRRRVGRDFGGWFSPALSQTSRTPDLVAEAGIDYFGDWVQDDQPIPIRVDSGWLLSMPYSVDHNDAVAHRQGHRAEVLADRIIEAAEVLHGEGADQAKTLCIAIHPYDFGQPHRIAELERALRHVRSMSGVWWTTGQELADWYRATMWTRMIEHLGTHIAPTVGAVT